MRFLPTKEQSAFAASLAALLAGSDVPAAARAWAVGDVALGRKLWLRLAEHGVHALGLGDEHGGVGAGPVDLAIAFEQLGRAGVPGPYVESVAVLPALLAGTAETARLEALGTGELVASVAIAPLVPFALDGAMADAVYAVDGSTLARAAVTGEIVSVDRTRRLAVVESTEHVGSIDRAYAVDLGAFATAAQLLGLGRAVLERTTSYAEQRTQFGAPIGSFQAVKHHLADAAVALEFARPLLFGAALTLGGATSERDVSAAKVACSEAAYRASRIALQVHGAIGYTAEYDLSLWITKIRALMSAWGTQRLHRTRLLQAIR